MSSCIPARKYEELEAKYKACDDELSKLKSDEESCASKLKDVEEELRLIEKDYTRTKNDLTLMEGSYKTLQTQYDHMERLNKEIMDKLKFLQDQAEDESAQKSDELREKELELFRKESDLQKLEDDLDKLKADLDAKKAELAEKEQRIDQLEELLRKKDEAVLALKQKVSDALTSFKDKGLSIEHKNGKVYVKMEAKLLFATGSTVVAEEGKQALIELAKVLEDQQDMEVVVEGHTDTDRLNSSSHPKNNWELSVLRSTSVVNIMIDNSSIDPAILTAAGRSEYHPVSDDKSKNRRIEIVLTPNLDELFEIIQN